ncbi:Rha family transcriptional regulator [Enterococcus hirae]
METIEQTITSNEVAKMVGRTHDNVLKDIRNIIKQIGGVKNHESYFIESTYTNSQNKELPNYLLTKKGCDIFFYYNTKGAILLDEFITRSRFQTNKR